MISCHLAVTFWPLKMKVFCNMNNEVIHMIYSNYVPHIERFSDTQKFYEELKICLS